MYLQVKLSIVCLIGSMRQDVFDNLVVANEKFGATMNAESKRYVERLIKLGKRNGTVFASTAFWS